AKGTIIKDKCDKECSEVFVDLAIQKKVKVPVPLEEEFVEKVEEAVGNEKAVAKKKIKHVNINKKQEVADKEKKLKEFDPVERKEKIKKETKDKRLQKVGRKMMTRAKRKERVRMDSSRALRMAAHVVDGQLNKEDTIRLPFDEDIFGHENFTYLDSQIKNKQKPDNGICFVNPAIISPTDGKAKSKHTEDASRAVVDRLLKRKNRDIIILPYNPGNHWVLEVLDLRKATCYYLDSLRPISFLEQLKQIIDMAMVVYAAQTGTGKVKLNWVNT
ncbi:hypothetical protein M8C21_006671, partial [Ambrosia artemisiifolia]